MIVSIAAFQLPHLKPFDLKGPVWSAKLAGPSESHSTVAKMHVHNAAQCRQPSICHATQIIPCLSVPGHARRQPPQCRQREQLCRPMHAIAEADAMADAAPSEGSGAAQAVETSGNSFAAVMDIEEIKKVLPHRHALGRRCA